MPYRYDRNSMGGRLLLYIRYEIPTKHLKHDFGTNIENLSVEINLQKKVTPQLKMGFQKKLPKIITYLDYKIFGNAKFSDDVNNFTFDKLDVSNFKETIFNIFDKHTPIVQKYLRANEAPFMTKELHREIMKKSRLRNNFFRIKYQEDRLKYNKQRNFC